MINKLMGRFSPNQLPELQKWIDDGVLDGSIETICSVRKKVEGILGKGITSNEKIIEGIINIGGVFTTRSESDTGDLCYVEIEKLIEILTNKEK